MTNGRKRFITACTGLALAAAIGFVPSSPAAADPDIDDVQAKVDTLYHQAEQASERYNDAKLELDTLTKDLGSLKSDEKRQGDAVTAARDDVQGNIVRQFVGQDLGAAGKVLVSGDTQEFLDQMSTMSAFGQLQDQLFADYSDELDALTIRRDATQKRLDQVDALTDQLADEKKTIDVKYDDAKSLLDRLKDEEREEILSRGGSDRIPSSVPASGRAAAAVKYAMAQVGKSYVYGAAGPSSFDCSGLTMMAWAQAGVGLPHSSSAQSGMGQSVSQSELQPGDLIFYYSPISHVAMYIGNGMIVHAANPSSGVQVSGAFTMPYSGAVRPG